MQEKEISPWPGLWIGVAVAAYAVVMSAINAEIEMTLLQLRILQISAFGALGFVGVAIAFSIFVPRLVAGRWSGAVISSVIPALLIGLVVLAWGSQGIFRLDGGMTPIVTYINGQARISLAGPWVGMVLCAVAVGLGVYLIQATAALLGWGRARN